MLCSVVGDFEKVVRTKSKEEIIEDLYQVLKSMYGEKAVRPEDILIPDWDTNPLFFGMFSSWPIGKTSHPYLNFFYLLSLDTYSSF